MRMSGFERVQGRCDLLGTANEERVPGFGKEAPVGEDDLTDPGVGRLLQEHADVMRLLPQPCEERRGRLERPPFDFGVPEVHQAFERFMESEQVAALEHRAEEGRRACSWCAPQCEHRHRRNVSLNGGKRANRVRQYEVVSDESDGSGEVEKLIATQRGVLRPARSDYADATKPSDRKNAGCSTPMQLAGSCVTSRACG